MTEGIQAVEKLPPQSMEVEAALLGSLIIDRDAIAAVADVLKPDAFASAAHRVIYAAVREMFRRGVPCDFVTLPDELERRGRLGDVGGHAYLAALATAVPTSFHVEYYAQEVLRYAYRRAVIDLGTDLVRHAYATESEFDPHAIIRRVMAAADALVTPAGSGPRSYADLIPGFSETIRRSWAGEDVFSKVPFGFRDVDRALRGGLRGGDLCVVAARPSAGKTAFALQVGHNYARMHRGQVLIFSAEMSAESLLWRALSETSGIPEEDLEAGTIPEHMVPAVDDALDRLAGLPVLIDDSPRPTVEQMLARAARVQRDGPLGLVVFDYMEQAGDTVGRGEGEERRIAAVSRGLKHLAQSLNVPVVAIAQVSRKVEERTDKRPRMSDIKWSGSIEQDADVIALLYREAYYVQQGMASASTNVAPDAVEVNIAKQRNGTTGVYLVRFHERLMAFSDYGDNRYGSE